MSPWDQVDAHGICWLWLGPVADSGYGRHKQGWVHRMVWEALVGPIPEGMELDHVCRVRHCCNPDHLRIVTTAENVLAGYGPTALNARKTVAPCGHEYDSFGPDGRRCHRCMIDRKRRERQAREAKRREAA